MSCYLLVSQHQNYCHTYASVALLLSSHYHTWKFFPGVLVCFDLGFLYTLQMNTWKIIILFDNLTWNLRDQTTVVRWVAKICWDESLCQMCIKLAPSRSWVRYWATQQSYGQLTFAQTINFKLFQTEKVCRWQFQIWWKWKKVLHIGRKHCRKRRKILGLEFRLW